jgi:AraC-like DNA-binding protein
VLVQRIERAKRLLKSPSFSALDIPVCLGFADAGHCSKVVRHSVGSTPSGYRGHLANQHSTPMSRTASAPHTKKSGRAPHGLTATLRDRVNADLLAFIRT